MKRLFHSLIHLIFGEKTFSEILRFCIVGCTATIITYGVYLLCLLFANKNIAYTIGFIIGLAVNLFLTTRFTFKQSFSIKTSGGFLLSHLINYGIRLGLLNFFIWIGLSKEFAPIPAEIISIPIQYIFLYLVFKKL